MAEGANPFLWYELMTTDVEGAKAFYADVVGWGTQDWDGAAHPYTMWLADGQPVGGLMALPEEARAEGARPLWLGYVWAADVNAATERARSLGATGILPPKDIPEVGRFSVIHDPQGAGLALFRPADPADMPRPPEGPRPGRVAWHELMTTDPEAGWAFHRELFGWTETDTMDMGEMGTYRMFGAGGPTLGGIMGWPPGASGRPRWIYYVTVPDLDKALERVTAGGGKVMNGPMTVPGGDRVAQCADPQGAWFALHAVGA